MSDIHDQSLQKCPSDTVELPFTVFFNIFENIEATELKHSLKFSSWQQLSGKKKSSEIGWVEAFKHFKTIKKSLKPIFSQIPQQIFS